jgi:hypothetical protein
MMQICFTVAELIVYGLVVEGLNICVLGLIYLTRRG